MEIKPPPSLALRQDTADLHQQLDAGSVMSCLMHDGLTVPMYAAVLQRLLLCHAWVEAQLQCWLQDHRELAWLDDRLYQRSALLQHDLLALKVQPAVPLPTVEADECLLSTPATAVGMVYVVAGSSLGARVLERRVQASLGFEVAGALAFLSAGTRLDMPSWPTLKQHFDQALSSPRAVQQAVWAARHTFACFVKHLTPPLGVGNPPANEPMALARRATS
jgi:heme oxygenase